MNCWVIAAVDVSAFENSNRKSLNDGCTLDFRNPVPLSYKFFNKIPLSRCQAFICSAWDLQKLSFNALLFSNIAFMFKNLPSVAGLSLSLVSAVLFFLLAF